MYAMPELDASGVHLHERQWTVWHDIKYATPVPGHESHTRKRENKEHAHGTLRVRARPLTVVSTHLTFVSNFLVHPVPALRVAAERALPLAAPRGEHVQPAVEVRHDYFPLPVAADAKGVRAARQPQHLQRHAVRRERLQPCARRLGHVKAARARRDRDAERAAELSGRVAFAAEEAAQPVRRRQIEELRGHNA